MRNFLLICTAFFFISFTHPFYVSICQIDLNRKTEALEITFKIFADDLEKGLETQGTGKLYLGTERESKEANKYIFKYLENNFKIKIDEKSRDLHFIGKEVEKDVVWCYVEVKEIRKIGKVTITNSILTEQFENQSNIVHIKAGKVKKSMLLNKSKITDIVIF